MPVLQFDPFRELDRFSDQARGRGRNRAIPFDAFPPGEPGGTALRPARRGPRLH